jgi:hypothetical protein
MHIYCEAWIPPSSVSRQTPWQWPAMMVPTTANFADNASGVAIDGSDRSFRRREERTMAVGNDGDDIVLYRYTGKASFQPRDLLVKSGAGNDICRIDIAGDLGPQVERADGDEASDIC